MTHLGLIVNDVQEKARIWAEVLNVEIPAIVTTDIQAESTIPNSDLPSNRCGKRALFYLDNIIIELIEPVDNSDDWREVLDHTGESIHCITFFGKNMHEKIIFARQRDGRLLQQRET